MKTIDSGILVCYTLLLVVTSLSASEDFLVTKIGDTVVDTKALTIKGSFGQAINGKAFQQDAVVSHKGYQYVAYYDAERHVWLNRCQLVQSFARLLLVSGFLLTSSMSHLVKPSVECGSDSGPTGRWRASRWGKVFR